MATSNTPPVVLVAEDEDALRTLAALVLRSLGYEVKLAADGEEALRIVAQPGPIDLILSDVRMPNCSGPEFVSKARCLRPGLRAIFTTAYPRTRDCDLFEGYEEERGMDLIPKPYTVVELATRVSAALECALPKCQPLRPDRSSGPKPQSSSAN